MDKYYSTRKLFGPKKAELWLQFINETYVELDCEGLSRDNFFGELRARKVGKLGISSITTDAYDVFRTDSGISTSEDDAFIISIQTYGTAIIRQLDREVTLKPGDFTIYDATMPYHLHFANRSSELVIKVPRLQLKQYLQSPETLTALHVKGSAGISRLTTNFAQTLFHETNMLDQTTQGNMANTLLGLVTSSIRNATSEIQRAPRNKATQLLRVKQFIAQNLRNPNLDLKMVAQSQHISDRYIHKLFAESDMTPSRFIWNERIKAAQIDLSNPLLAHRSISEICYAWGFSDTTHFSRSFKKKYDLSPKAFRAKAFEGVKL